MKKTPMQEFLEDMDACKVDFFVDEDKWLQKEKAFAFDCWMEATNLAYWNHSMFAESSDKPKFTSFDEFYSQYAEKHT